MSPQPKSNTDVRTAGIGSPHLQRNRNLYNELDNGCNNEREKDRLFGNQSTAISTPTSPHMGKYQKFSDWNISLFLLKKTQQNIRLNFILILSKTVLPALTIF